MRQGVPACPSTIENMFFKSRLTAFLGPEDCSECNPGFFLSDGRCEAYPCVVGQGEMCKECMPPEARRGHHQCLVPRP